jgi:hypothetical protein
MHPGCADISEHWPGYGLYAGLADTLIFRPGPTLVNQNKVNYFPYVSSLLTLPGVIPPTPGSWQRCIAALDPSRVGSPILGELVRLP